MNALQRALDALRHRGEYPQQRIRRRWLEGLARATPSEPYQLTTTRPIDADRAAELRRSFEAQRAATPARIVGVTATIASPADVHRTPPAGGEIAEALPPKADAI